MLRLRVFAHPSLFSASPLEGSYDEEEKTVAAEVPDLSKPHHPLPHAIPHFQNPMAGYI